MLHAVLLLSLIWCATANHESEKCDFRRQGIIEGNITLGFMFPFFDSFDETSTVCDESSIPNPNSIQLVEAAIFALGRGQSRIPGITIGLEAYDSCSSTAAALDRSTFFVRDRLIGNLMEESQSSCGEKLKPGFIGALHDELGIVVGSFLSNSFVTVTGYAAELPQLTTSKNYEYFTRTIISDQEEIEVWTDFLQVAKWTHVSVVYSRGENQLTDARLFEERVKSAMICISQQYVLNDTADAREMDTTYSLILQSDVDAVVLILEDEIGEDFLKAVARNTNGRKMQFLVPFDLYLEIDTEDLPDNIIIVGAVPEISHPGNGDDDFDTYFKNLTPQTYNQIADPWFKYYWESSYGCVINSSSANQLCGMDAVNLHKGLYERNPFVTSVIDAIDAHIEALATLLQCEGGQCNSSEITLNPEEYLDTLKNVDLTRNEGGRERRVAFTPNGDPADNKFLILLTGMNQDEALIYRWDNGQFSPPLINGIADLLSPSECADPCFDPSCFELRELEEGAEAYAEGDIILAGFFPVNEWDETANQCGDLTGIGVLYVQAMLYAIDKINDDPSILPGIQLGMDGFNTCSSPQKATDIAHQLATQGVFGDSSSATRLSPDGERLEHFFGVIGPKSLEETAGVNQITRSRKVTMVGYDTDSPTINSFTYPYYARLLSSATSSIQPLLQFLSRNNITYFQILYSGNRFQAPTSTFVSFLESGSWTGVCAAQSVPIPASVEAGEDENEAAWDDLFATMNKKPDAKAVYLVLSNEDILRVLQQMKTRELFREYFIMAGSSWELTEEDEVNFVDVIRGGVIVKSIPRTYENFKEYINRDLRLPDTRNPWLSDYCSQRSTGSECTGNTAVFDDLMNDEAIPRIIDSTYAMANALHNVQRMLCPGTDRVCKGMLDADGDTIFQSLKTTTFISINGDNRPISFDFSGNLQFAYEIFNYQGISNKTVTKEKIGQVVNWQFTDETEVKFYDESGMEIRSDNEKGSRCTSASCEKGCQRSDHDAVAEISMNGQGDVWLGGFFEVTEPAQDPLQCSDEIIDENVPLVEAFLFAIEQINNDPTILPDLNLAGIAFDSCGSPNRVIKEAGNLVVGTIDYRARFFNQQLNVFGVIGGASSDTTHALSQTLADLGINQISYGATAIEFSDPLEHPYVLRTVPSDRHQAAAFVDILAQFSWNYVSVVYSDNLFGNDMLEEFTRRITEERAVCVAMTLKVQRTFSEADYDLIATTLKSNPNNRVVLMFTSDVDTRSVLQAANRMDISDLQWVGSDTWGDNDYVIENTNIAALGALTISFESQRVPSFESYFNDIYPWTYRRNPWFQKYYSDYFKCDLSLNSGYGVWCNPAFNTFPAEVISKNPQVVSIINAVNAYAYGLQAALDVYCSEDEIQNHICNELQNRPAELHKTIQDTMFPSAHDESILLKFNEFGDSPGNYDILNIQNKGGVISYKKVGSWREGTLNFTEDPLFFRNGENVTASPTQCTGRCRECRTVDFSYVSLDGPIQIVGLAGVHDAGDHVNECGTLNNMGVLDVEAFLFAIDYVNRQDDILPGVQLGAKIFDTCQSSARGIRELSSFLGGAGSFADITEWQWIGGIISGGAPSVIETGYQVAEQFKHPQVVYTPSPPTLDDANFLIKASPTVNDQVQAILDLLQRFGWTFISVIADASDKQQMLLYNTFIQSASDLCLDQNLTFTCSDTLDTAVSSLQGPANVVVMFASAAMINNIKKSATYHNTFVFAGVGSHEDIVSSDAIAGSLILSYSQRSAAFEDFLNGQLAVDSLNSTRNPWLPEYISTKLSCNVGNVTKFEANCDDGVNTVNVDQSEMVNAKFIVNSVIGLARSLSGVQNDTCVVNTGLCPEFVETNEDDFLAVITNIGPFPDENGDQVVFQNGQQQVDFSIWNIPSSESGSNIVKIDGTNPSFVDQNGRATGTVKSVCPLDTTTAPPSTKPQTNARTNARETKPTPTSKVRPTANGGTLARTYEDFHQEVWFIIALILSGIGTVITIIVAVFFFKKSETMYAQCHSSFLVYLLLLALLVMFLQTVLFGLQVNFVICALRRIIPGVSFFTCFLSIFLISVRFFRIRKKENLGSGLGSKYIDNKSQIIAAACILPIESIILLQWLFYERPSAGAIGEDNLVHCSNINSTFPVSFLVIYILMVGGLMVAILGLRRSKTHFAAELKSIIICIALSFIIAVVWIVCCILLERGSLVPLTAFAGIFQGIVVLVTIFPLIIKGLLRNEDFQVDSMSVIDGDAGFTNPVSSLENPYENLGSPEKAKEAAGAAGEATAVELKVAEEESHM